MQSRTAQQQCCAIRKLFLRRHGVLGAARFVPRIYSSSCPEPAIPPGPLKQYEQMVSQGILQHDVQQHRVAATLERLLENLKIHQRNMELYNIELQSWKQTRHELRQHMLEEEAELEAQKKSELSRNWRESIGRLLTRRGMKREVEPGAGKMVARIKRERRLDELIGSRPLPPQAPQGIYLHGNVGCGKTLLMDLLFNASKGVVRYRRRMHFHAAMLELHHLMHNVWKQHHLKVQKDGPASNEQDDEDLLTDRDSFSPILDAVAEGFLGAETIGFEGASLLCFDEVQVVDPFTAVALAGVLGRLLKKGLVLVATSNRPFSELNKDGMQKEIFLKFIGQLEKHCHPVFVGDDIDYRRVLANSYDEKQQTNYFWPLDSQSESALARKWHDLKGSGSVVSSGHVPVMFGRILEVPESCDGIAKFTFEQLCEKPVGSADYMALAQHYHTVFVTGIPVMSMKIRDKARRFITLVDELYNHHCQLVCTAAAPPDELFLGTDEGPLIDLEGLQFETEAEGTRLRRNVLLSGSVAPLGGSKEEHKSVQQLLSGYEEMFAFRRAASRLIEMQTPSYLHKLHARRD